MLLSVRAYVVYGKVVSWTAVYMVAYTRRGVVNEEGLHPPWMMPDVSVAVIQGEP